MTFVTPSIRHNISLLCSMMTLFLISCSNDNSYTNSDIPSDKFNQEIPIRLTGQVFEIKSRTQGNSFIENDKIGVYVLKDPNALSETRHEENVCFTFHPNGNFIPDHEIYFPLGNVTSTFISYYPYQEKAVSAGSSLLPVSVKPDQSSDENYSHSDLLTATLKDVYATKRTIMLSYKHCMSLLNIIIETTNDFDKQSIETGAIVTINGLYTEAMFDLENGLFSNLTTVQNLIPHGKWTNLHSENLYSFSGKQVIIPPQETNNGEITITTNNKEYSAKFPTTLKLEKGKLSTLTLHFNSQKGINGINASISNWEESLNNGETDLNQVEKLNMLAVDEKLFTKSAVVDLVDKDGNKLGSVCKEYLSSPSTNIQAYVLYQGNNDTSGKVMRVLGNEQNIHGGNVTWNGNSLTYTPGTTAANPFVFLSKEGQLLTEPSESRLELKALPRVLYDNRGTESICYPIVKIGKSYWTAENLKATRYTNGLTISDHTHALNASTPGRYELDNNLTYNRSCVLSGYMAPTGWRIANEDDWNTLGSYISHNANAVKNTEEWFSSNQDLVPNNFTGLNILPTGGFTANKLEAATAAAPWGKGEAALFWSMSQQNNSLAEHGILFRKTNNDFNKLRYNSHNYYAYSIRLVKE